MAVYPYKMDQRLLRIRRKTIWEMKPAVLFSAASITVADGTLVPSWIDRRAGVTVAQSTDSKKPTYLAAGIGNSPCLLFDGGDTLDATAVPLTGANFTVIAELEMSAETSAGRRIFYYTDDGTANNFISFGVDTAGKATIYTRKALTFNVVTGDTVLGTAPHTIIYTVNEAGDAWEIYVDGEAETLTTVGTNTGDGFTSYGTLSRVFVGGTNYFIGKLAYIAGWNERI